MNGFQALAAHSGETHTSRLATTAHELGWYVQIPLFFLLITMIAAAVWLATKKVDTALLVTSFVMLVGSFLLFEIAPAVSVIAITFGLIITLGVTFIGLGAQDTSD